VAFEGAPNKGLGWYAARDIAETHGGRLPSEQEFKEAALSSGDFDQWMPIADRPGLWIQSGDAGRWGITEGYDGGWYTSEAPHEWRPTTRGSTEGSPVHDFWIVKQAAETTVHWPALFQNPSCPKDVAYYDGLKTDRAATHRICRGLEKTAEDAKIASCNLAETYARETYDVLSPQCGVFEDARKMKDRLVALNMVITTHQGTLNSMIDQCESDTQFFDTKAAECDEAQINFDTAFCTYHTQYAMVCNQLDTCYSVAESAATKEGEDTSAEEAHFKALWVSSRKVRCFVGLLQDALTTKITAANLTACVNEVYDTGDFDIDYGSIPAKGTCVATTEPTTEFPTNEFPQQPYLQPTVVCPT
jgi:hypothetical protein